MLKIGDFSKLGSVTVKTLRHYARLGLLKPAWIDRYSGYRFYTLQQLPRLNRILAFKDLGFSLEQIAGLLDEEVPLEQMRGMLRRKQSELEERLRTEQNRLAFVAARLAQLDGGGGASLREVLVKHAAAAVVAVIHEVVPALDQLPARTALLAAELESWAAGAGLALEGPWMVLQPFGEYRDRDIPLSVAAPLEPAAMRRGAPEGGNRIRLQTLFPAELACLVHTGPAETLVQSYAALYAWMEANRRAPTGPARELRLRDPGGSRAPDPFTLSAPAVPASPPVIEIQIPVQPNEFVHLKETPMEPKIVTRPAFTVMGLCYHGNNQNQEISAMWGEFNRRAEEVLPYTVPGFEAIGVCLMPEGLPEGHFEYVAGFEVTPGAPVPQGMAARGIPAGKYAVFEHRGSLEKLGETYQSIYQAWLPQSGLELAGMDMEVYTDEFKDFAPDSVFYIYVMVK